jgi:hypothetical protein
MNPRGQVVKDGIPCDDDGDGDNTGHAQWDGETNDHEVVASGMYMVGTEKGRKEKVVVRRKKK